jgi:hypothetical protein
VTFLAASGDSGAGTIWPAVSPNVVAVGGTTLHLTSTNTISSETGWGNGPFSFFFGGSGGGFSQFEALPTYQSNISTVSNGFKLTSFGVRLNPDVAYVADPNTGVSVLDGADGGWFTVGGTSAGAPQWAGLIAIADQGRALAGKTPLSSTQTLSAIYNSSNASGFHDITRGSSTGAYDVVDSNGNIVGTITVAPGTGFDMVTGVGSPVANVLVPDLVTVASASPVRTAGVASFAATGSAGSKNSGKAGAKDVPSNNNANSGTTTTSTNLAAQQLLALSVMGPSVGLLSASVAPAPPATAAAIQPVPAVQSANSVGSTSSLLSRYTGITGGGDSLGDGLITPEEPTVPPAPPQEAQATPVTPASPVAPTDDTTMNQSMSRAELDAYIIAVSLAGDLPARAQVTILAAEEPSTAIKGAGAGMTGLIALLGGCWAAHGPREEAKKPPAIRNRRWVSNA